ncbi:MAG TPA: hypothetical protein VFW71_13530 [Actinomycetota bacterium]|nr:hypothetical protein [Actinomycetota bacterium]
MANGDDDETLEEELDEDLEDDEDEGEDWEGDELDVPVTAELEEALEAFVLIADWDLALSRAETFDFVVESLRDLEDDDALEGWVRQYRGRDFHLAQERDGRLVVSDVFPVAGVLGLIPRSMLDPVLEELMAQPEDDRPAWVESLGEVIGDWVLLLSDEEKMVGHLIRAHEVEAGRTAGELADLAALHAELHSGLDTDDGADD